VKLRYDKSFLKDLDNITDRSVKKRTLSFIEKIKQADTLSDIPNVKKLSGYKNFFRYKISQYRIGFRYTENTVILIVIKHRKDIYKHFP